MSFIKTVVFNALISKSRQFVADINRLNDFSQSITKTRAYDVTISRVVQVDIAYV